MKIKFKISSKILIFIALVVSIGHTSVSNAAWNTSAVDYINVYGEALVYREGSFWFAQYGSLNDVSSYRYSVLGFKVKVDINNEQYLFKGKLGETFPLVNETVKGNYVYSLWRLDYNKAVTKLKAAYPSVNLQALSDRSTDTNWFFDSIMTIKTPGMTSGGVIDDLGNQIKAPIYRTKEDILGTGYFSYTSQSEIEALFGIVYPVPASSKPIPLYPEISNFFIKNYDYKEPDSDVYWAKPTTKLILVNEGYMDKSYGVFPDAMYVRVYKGLYSDKNWYTFYITNLNVKGAWMDGSGIGRMTVGDYTKTTYNDVNKKYMSAEYELTLPQDGEVFRFRNVGFFNGHSNEYVESDVLLKIDGTAPTISGATEVEWTNEDKVINIKATDSGSGIESIVLYKNNEEVASSTGTSLTYTNTSTGSFEVVATDKVGNSSSETFIHNIDKDEPTITWITQDKIWSNIQITVGLRAYDSESGICLLEYKLSGAINKGWETYDMPFNISTNGKTTVTARAHDYAGNVFEDSVEIWYDDIIPTTTISTTKETWKNKPIPVTINASDGLGSGIAWREYRLSGAQTQDWTTYTGEFSISKDGITTITARSYDYAGNVSYQSSAEVWYDGSKPWVGIYTTRETWKSTPIKVSMIGGDDGDTGLNRIEYKLSGAKTQGWTTYNSPITISSNGKTTITARAIDNVGNISDEEVAEVWYDALSPTVTYTANVAGWGEATTITVKVEDAHSGPNKILDMNNNLEYLGNTKTFTVFDNGTYKYRGYDMLGNYTDISVIVNQIDNIKPTVSILTMANKWIRMDVPVIIMAKDNESGIDKIEYMLSGATSKPWTTYLSMFDIVNNGITVIKAKSTDKAGNVSDIVSEEVWVDKIKPTGVFTTPTETTNRNIIIQASSLTDIHSGVNEIRISNVSNYATYTSYSVKGKTSDALSFELDKKGTIDANYTDRIVYIRLIDVAGNYTDYQLKVEVNPAPPSAPTISLPDNTNPVYVTGEIVNVKWTHNNGSNDFTLPQISAKLVLVNNDTGYTQVFMVDGSYSEYYFNRIPNGQYTLTIATNNIGAISSATSSVKFRYNKFLDDGLVRTIEINPANNVSKVAIVTDSEIPVGCSIEGVIYYKANIDGTIDYTEPLSFKIDSDGLDNIYVLPEVVDKLRIDLTLKNRTNPKNNYLSPILDRIQVYAR